VWGKIISERTIALESLLHFLRFQDLFVSSLLYCFLCFVLSFAKEKDKRKKGERNDKKKAMSEESRKSTSWRFSKVSTWPRRHVLFLIKVWTSRWQAEEEDTMDTKETPAN